MVCETRLKSRQTVQERLEEIRRAVATLSTGLASGRVKALVGPQGAIAFIGLTEAERSDTTDACLYRLLLSTGSRLALQAIAHAEALAGRTIDMQAVAAGVHLHGNKWHRGH
jgi:hypothetical protein